MMIVMLAASPAHQLQEVTRGGRQNLHGIYTPKGRAMARRLLYASGVNHGKTIELEIFAIKPSILGIPSPSYKPNNLKFRIAER